MSEELSSNYRAMLDVKERELERLRAALDNSEKQLKIQTQVLMISDIYIVINIYLVNPNLRHPSIKITSLNYRQFFIFFLSQNIVEAFRL